MIDFVYAPEDFILALDPASILEVLQNTGGSSPLDFLARLGRNEHNIVSILSNGSKYALPVGDSLPDIIPSARRWILGIVAQSIPEPENRAGVNAHTEMEFRAQFADRH